MITRTIQDWEQIYEEAADIYSRACVSAHRAKVHGAGILELRALREARAKASANLSAIWGRIDAMKNPVPE